jgi:hypothetical protein
MASWQAIGHKQFRLWRLLNRQKSHVFLWTGQDSALHSLDSMCRYRDGHCSDMKAYATTFDRPRDPRPTDAR